MKVKQPGSRQKKQGIKNKSISNNSMFYANRDFALYLMGRAIDKSNIFEKKNIINLII